MNYADALALASKIKLEVPDVTVAISQDAVSRMSGVEDYVISVRGSVQFNFAVRSEEQWQERKKYVVQQGE
jgi:hypothetical protein